MKKKLLYLFITISSISFSQTLDNTYITSGDDYRNKPDFAFNTNSETWYYTLDWASNEVKIYDSSHNIYKTVSINLENDYKMRNLYFATDKLFNSNSKIEFLISSNQTSSPYQSSLKLFDEDGNLLFDFGNSRGIKLFKTSDNEYKLLTAQNALNSNEISYKVYSLSGTLFINQQNLINKTIIQFPNPASEVLNIKNLKSNENESLLEIFSIQGKKVLSKKIRQNKTDISINISPLIKGTYIYKIGELSNKFIKK